MHTNRHFRKGCYVYFLCICEIILGSVFEVRTNSFCKALHSKNGFDLSPEWPMLTDQTLLSVLLGTSAIWLLMLVFCTVEYQHTFAQHLMFYSI